MCLYSAVTLSDTPVMEMYIWVGGEEQVSENNTIGIPEMHYVVLVKHNAKDSECNFSLESLMI